MTGTSTVAVVIPYYEHHEFIDATLDSVARQTRPVERVILVDDGSPKPFQLHPSHSRLNVHVHRHGNLGLAHARNVGFGMVETEYVIPLDSDDVLHHDFVAATLDVAESTRAPFVYCDIETFGAETAVYRHPPYDFARLCRGNYIVATSLIRTSTFDAVGHRNGHGYDPGIGGYEDHLFYLEAGAIGLYGTHLPRVLFKYRRREGSMLGHARARFSAIRAYMRQKMISVHGIDIGALSAPGEP